MTVDRYRVNDVLTALAYECGVTLDDDVLNDLTHTVADVLDANLAVVAATRKVPIHLLKEGDVIASNGLTVTSVEWTNHNDGFFIVGTDRGDFRFDDGVDVTVQA
jgi:hypothetical protein